MKRDAIIDEVLGNLAGFLTDQELVGTVTVDNNTSATVSLEGLQPGLVEFGNGELVYVGAVDGTSLTGLIRGYRSTPTASQTGKQFRANPRYPRWNVLMAINRCLDGLWPDLFTMNTLQVPSALGQTYYSLPPECEDVLSVAQYDTQSGIALPSAWRKCRYWTFMPDAPIDPTNADPRYGTTTGKGVQVNDAWQDDSAILQVTYTTKPLKFDTDLSNDQEFVDATALPDWAEDVVASGATYRLIQFVAAGEAAARTAEGDLLGMQGGVKPDPEGMTELFFSVYKQRLEEAKARMRQLVNVGSVHYSAG